MSQINMDINEVIMRKILNWLKNVVHLSKIVKSLDQAVGEVAILRQALDDLSDELQDLRDLNAKYKEELELFRSKRSE